MNLQRIAQLLSDVKIQQTIALNKVKATEVRDAELMILGYHQALLDHNIVDFPEGWTKATLQDVVNKQREKLGV